MHLTPKQLQIVNFIRSYREQHGYSPTLDEIGNYLGVCKITIFEHIGALEKKGAVSRTPHQARSIEVVEAEVGSREFPLLGYIAAGRPIEAVETPDTLDLSEALVGRKDCYILQVKGNSMIDEQICDGDYVIVEKRKTAHNGETVVALINGEEATLKKFYKEKDRIRLQPANETMEPIYAKDVQIHGVVVGVMRKY
ncbi:MAG: transcriptional repressor LexA [Planctomycetota bacterium]